MTPQPELIWGAKAIAKVINRSAAATFHMLEAGEIAGAQKIGGRWAFNLATFMALFEKDSK